MAQIKIKLIMVLDFNVFEDVDFEFDVIFDVRRTITSLGKLFYPKLTLIT